MQVTGERSVLLLVALACSPGADDEEARRAMREAEVEAAAAVATHRAKAAEAQPTPETTPAPHGLPDLSDPSALLNRALTLDDGRARSGQIPADSLALRCVRLSRALDGVAVVGVARRDAEILCGLRAIFVGDRVFRRRREAAKAALEHARYTALDRAEKKRVARAIVAEILYGLGRGRVTSLSELPDGALEVRVTERRGGGSSRRDAPIEPIQWRLTIAAEGTITSERRPRPD